MWHELVLCGVGGRTIAEAKRRMSYAEFVSWCTYRNKRGTFNQGMRVDRSVARSTAFFGNMLARSKTLKAEDFSPFDERQEQGIEDVFSHFKSLAGKE